jgi:PKD repeat protein
MKGIKYLVLALAIIGILSGLGATVTATSYCTVTVGPNGTQPVPDVIQLYADGERYSQSNVSTAKFVVECGAIKVYVIKQNYQTWSTELTVSEDTVLNYTLISSASNNPPVANFTFSTSGLTVSVDASSSYDPDGDTLTYYWNWGDSALVQQGDAITNHTYATNGTYNITLTVVDSHGASNSITRQVTVSSTNPPVPVGTLYVKKLDFDDSVKPGEDVEFELKVENGFSSEVYDVSAEIRIVGINTDGEDLVDTIDFGRISPGKYKSDTVYFTIPSDAQAKKYTVKVKLSWTDMNGNYQESDWWTAPSKLSVERPKHQILINDVTLAGGLTPGGYGEAAISIENSGASDENVQVRLTTDFGANEIGALFKLKSGESTVQYLRFAIPENVKPGNYFLTVNVVYGTNIATKKVVLTITNPKPIDESVVSVVPQEQPKQEPPVLTIALLVVIALLAGVATWLGLSPKPTPVVAKRRMVR